MIGVLARGAVPALFVLIWSTGWIVAGYSALYADPLTFLTLRFAIAGVLLAAICVVLAAPWPKSPREWGHALVVGALFHGCYLAGVWWAVRHGVPAGVSGLLAATQPIMMVALSRWALQEHISPVRWAGIAIGFVGIALVLSPKFSVIGGTFAPLLVPIAINMLGMISATLGSLYQKRFQQTGDLRSMTAIQYIGAVAVTTPLAFKIGRAHV